MAVIKKLHVGLSIEQVRLLEKLKKKLMLDAASVLRLALARLAEQENVK